MSDLMAIVEIAIIESDKAIKSLGKTKTTQVSASDEREYLKAVALSWLRNHRLVIAKWANCEDIEPLDIAYQSILTATAKRASRKPLLASLKNCKQRLISLRSKLALVDYSTVRDEDGPPNFSPLAADKAMQEILVRRWHETTLCIQGGAYLAATVMMGGLIEALLVARVAKMDDKSPVFTAASAPRDKATGKTFPQKEWTLRNYIDVAHELSWVSQSGKDVSEVLMEYRNYIHPYKEYSHRVMLGESDAEMFWNVAKSLASQVIKSA